jgi:hypothetical protein
MTDISVTSVGFALVYSDKTNKLTISQSAGLRGPAGNAGARGSLWTSGAGAPTGTAQANDMYLDTSTGDVWKYS